MLNLVRSDRTTLRSDSSELYVRPLRSSDRKQIVSKSIESQSFHSRWVSAPVTNHTFNVYFQRCKRDDHRGFVVCLHQNDDIVGVVNLNNIVFSSIQSCSIGYYIFEAYKQQGLMTDAINIVVEYAFKSIGLHRVEADIQPANMASRRLVQKCGFKFEGVARELLFLNGRWRDHERWSKVDKRDSLAPVSTTRLASGLAP